LLALLLQRQEALAVFEELYWDIAATRQELVIREENLERSRRILSWIEERFNRSAAERVDILQAQALVSGRELQLQLAADTLKASQARLKEQISFPGDLVPEDMDLENERPLVSLAARADFAPEYPVLIRSLQSRSEAGLLKAKARLASDQLKPRLELGYSYGQQGFHPSLSGARDQAFSRHNDYHQIGIVFSVPLGRSLIRKARESADIAASSGEIRAQKLERQSSIQWSELERTLSEQKQRLGIARELSRLQHDKSREERLRFEKGRSTAFQAITFEQDAAESQLLVLEQLRQLRQTEARARLFVMRGSVAP
jgi:outer membrane protein TolC